METTDRAFQGSEPLEGTLRANADLAVGIVASALDAIIVIDDAEKIVYFNPAAERVFASSAKDAIGNSVSLFIPPRYRDAHTQHIRRFAESGAVNLMLDGPGPVWGMRATGEEFPMEASISKVESGGERFFTAVFRDISERYRAEQAVRESEQRFYFVADTAPVLIWISDINKLCTYFNKPWLTFRGRQMEEELGEGWVEGVHPDDVQRCLDTYGQAFERRQRFEMEYRLRRYDGEYRCVLDVGAPRFNQDGSFAGYIGIAVDLTERRQASDALSRYAAIVKSSDEAIMAADTRGIITDWNMAAERLFGYHADEIIGSHITILGGEFHPVEVQNNLRRIVNGELVQPYETIRHRKDGTPVVIWLTLSPIVDPDGKIVGAAGICRDISEMKRAQEALARHSAIVESSEDAIISKSLDGVIQSWNPGAEQIFGYTQEEAVGKSIRILIPNELQDEETRILREVGAGERIHRCETTRITKTGKRINVSLSVSPIRDSEGNVVGVSKIAHDITEQKLADRQRQLSENRFHHFFETVPEYCYMISPEGKIIDANPAACSALGYTRDEMAGMPVSAIYAPEYYQKAGELLRRWQTDGLLRNEEIVVISKQGQRRSVLLNVGAIRDAAGNVVSSASVHIDITERKQAEAALSGMAQKLVEVQEQERARIARELHDDITQRLAMLAIELGQIQANCSDVPADVVRCLRELRQRTTQISADVQALSHDLHSSNFEYLGVAEGIKSWCVEFGERKGMEIEFNSFGLLDALPTEIALCLFRVLQEAANNAAKHARANRLEIQLREDQGEIFLAVRDFGTGFDVEAARRGRGLGLTSMQERVRLVGGAIKIDSKPLEGTSINVRVPLNGKLLRHDSSNLN